MRARSRPDGATVAVVGAQSPEGAQIRRALSDLGVAGGRVDLYSHTRGQAVLTECDGEAGVIQEPDASDIVAHEVVLLCKPGDATDDILAQRGEETLVVDVAGCLPQVGSAPVVHPGIRPWDPTQIPGVVAVPHGISAVLAEVLHPLDAGPGLRRVTAVVLRPAADFGDPGIDELREQTVRLLSFGEIPREVFGRQLSFNLVPDRLLDRSGPALDDRIAGEVESILGGSDARLAVRLVNVPVFHGHAMLLSVELDGPADLGSIREILDATDGVERTKDEGIGTPMEVAADRRTLIAEVSDDRTGAFWIWLVAGEVGTIPAELAMRLARASRDL